MNRATKIAMILAGSTGLLLAESWTGTLIDATCKPANSEGNGKDALPSSCAATSSTKVFAIQTADGKVFRLDNAGNAKAVEVVKNSDPNKSNSVTVSGSLEGQMVKVDSIDQK
jgi:hypothetical protein